MRQLLLLFFGLFIVSNTVGQEIKKPDKQIKIHPKKNTKRVVFMEMLSAIQIGNAYDWGSEIQERDSAVVLFDYINNGDEDFFGDVAILVTPLDDMSDPLTIGYGEDWVVEPNQTDELELGWRVSELVAGDYNLSMVYQEEGSDEWFFAEVEGEFLFPFTIHEKVTDLRYRQELSLSPSYEINKDEDLRVQTEIQNFGNGFFEGAISLDLWDQNDQLMWEMITFYYIGDPMGSGNVLAMDEWFKMDLEPGTYYLTVSYNELGTNEWLYVADSEGYTHFEVVIKESIVADSYEYNNSPGSAHSFYPSWSNGSSASVKPELVSIHEKGDEDYYRVRLDAGFTYNIKTIVEDKYSRAEATDILYDIRLGEGDWEQAIDLDVDVKTIRVERATWVYFRFYAFDSDDIGLYNWQVNMTRSVISSSDEIAENAWQVRLNQGFLSVVAKSEIEFLKVYDLQGQTLINEAVQATEGQFEVGHLPKGMYVIQMGQSGGSTKEKRIVI